VSAGSIILVVVAVVMIAAIVCAAAAVSARRRRLRKRFGPEYERLVTELQSRTVAAAELSNRERRVQKLSLRDLSADARQRYAEQWAQVQERFVDTPREAVAQAQYLIESVMRERGYPAEDYEQELADLSVDHARIVDHFRSAHDISVKAAAASTEELRRAMLHYRELFDELLAPSAMGPAHVVG
jgi:hypothetical protein